MKIPSLKRITVSSAAELTKWLAGTAETPHRVVLVTRGTPSSPK